MLAAAPVEYRPPQFIQSTILCGSNEMPSTEAPTNHDHPKLQQNPIDRGSYKILLAESSTKYHWPSLLLNNGGYGSSTMPSTMATMNDCMHYNPFQTK